MSWNLDDEIEKMKIKGIESIQNEPSENSKSYNRDIINDKFCNKDDYEARIPISFILFVCFIIICAVLGVCYALTL
ncbi:MAG TPA: hypothetical protein PLO94_11055 [Chitinophagales bacterium]|nr:hypothetical protein [Chitinophagales bacterium]